VFSSHQKTVVLSTTHAQGTFPERLESASNSFVCTRETGLLWTLFNLTSTSDGPSSTRRPQLIRFPPERACRSATAACEECLARFAAADARNCTTPGISDDGQPRDLLSPFPHAGGSCFSLGVLAKTMSVCLCLYLP